MKNPLGNRPRRARRRLCPSAASIEVPTTVLMAGSVILTVPIIVLFFFSERWLAGGLTAGAEKG